MGLWPRALARRVLEGALTLTSTLASNLHHDSPWVEPAICELCGSRDVVTYHAYASHRLLRCTICQLVFQESSRREKSAALIPQIYNQTWVDERRAQSINTFLQHALFGVNLLGMFVPRPGLLLEIGSGTGEFAYMARCAGWNVVGVEPSEAACRYASSEFGLDLIHSIWSEELPEASIRYDAIAFWHVLEHIAEPVAFLREMAGMLAPGGRVLFSVPNLRSLTNAIMGVDSPLLLEVDHLFHFAVPHVLKMLNLAELEPTSIFSRQEPTRMETDVALGATMSGEFAAMGVHQKLGLLANLQAHHEGHEIVCVARLRGGAGGGEKGEMPAAESRSATSRGEAWIDCGSDDRQ